MQIGKTLKRISDSKILGELLYGSPISKIVKDTK